MAVKRRLLTSSVVTVEAVTRWLDETKPEIVIAESGSHFMWKIAFELARAREIRVVCREIGKGGFDSHIYSVNAQSMFPNWKDLWSETRVVPLNDTENGEVDNYLGNLGVKTYETRKNLQYLSDAERIKERFKLDDRRTAVLFTNVTWDLSTAGRDVAFDGLLDWILQTIRWFEQRPDVQLLIRAHPAENSVITSERVLDLITAHCPQLPDNVKLISPAEQISVRGLCDLASVILAYCSTTGIEAAIYNKPVLLSGAPHYRGKGFTNDVRSVEEYSDALVAWANGSLALVPEQSEVARRYFHLFFLRHHIPMHWTTSPLEPPFKLLIKELSELLPGRNSSVDIVCSGILQGHEILLPRR